MVARISVVVALVLAALPALAEKDWQACNFETHSGRMTISYDLIGPQACVGFCAQTDGCTAWVYTPHNFNPRTAPGECALYAEASGTRAPDSTAPNQFCGWIKE